MTDVMATGTWEYGRDEPQDEPTMPTPESEPPKWLRIGSVIVDSASLWIGDPAYPPRSGQAMSDVCGEHRFCDRKDWPHNGVYFFTLTGDGEYPVYAELDEDGDAMRVMVDMTVEADE